MSLSEESFSSVFTDALRGEPCVVVGIGEHLDRCEVLPVATWRAHADADDVALLRHCEGPTLDVGCGPGRMAAALAELGHVVLGIDVVPEAVGQTRERGVPAVRRDVLADTVPGEGRWRTALLADGNVGIGGDPLALLSRIAELLDVRGRIVVELGAPGLTQSSSWARLQCDRALSRPFRWAVLGVDDVAAVAARAGLRVAETARHGGRWAAVLVRTDGA